MSVSMMRGGGWLGCAPKFESWEAEGRGAECGEGEEFHGGLGGQRGEVL